MAFILKTQSRTVGTNLDKLRASGMAPAVVYGTGMKEAVSIAVPHQDMVKLYNEAGTSSLVTLEGDTGQTSVLIHDIQVDPVTNRLVHVDFLAIDVSQPVDVKVPLDFIGEAPAEKQGLGILTKVLREIEIKVLPSDIPHSLTVDLSGLSTLEDAIHAKDIMLPVSAKLVTEPDAVVVSIAVAKEEKESPTTIDFDAIATEEKGKKEEAE